MLTLHQHLVLHSEGEIVQYDTVKRCTPSQCYLKPIIAQKNCSAACGHLFRHSLLTRSQWLREVIPNKSTDNCLIHLLGAHHCGLLVDQSFCYDLQPMHPPPSQRDVLSAKADRSAKVCGTDAKLRRILKLYNVIQYLSGQTLDTVWPEILSERYFGGLLKLWHLAEFTLAVERVLAIIIFIAKWLIEHAGNLTGPWG